MLHHLHDLQVPLLSLDDLGHPMRLGVLVQDFYGRRISFFSSGP